LFCHFKKQFIHFCNIVVVKLLQILDVFINIHTHKELMDAKVELVSLHKPDAKKPNVYSFGIHPWKIDKNTDALWQEL